MAGAAVAGATVAGASAAAVCDAVSWFSFDQACISANDATLSPWVINLFQTRSGWWASTLAPHAWEKGTQKVLMTGYGGGEMRGEEGQNF